MSDIQSKATHCYTLHEAKSKTSALLAPLCQKYNLIASWQDNVLHFHGMGIQGSVAVCEQQVQVSVMLSALLKMFQDKIQHEIDLHLKQVFVEVAC